MKYSEFTVCLLHPREAEAFEHHGIKPGCMTGGDFHHAHISMRDADGREIVGHGTFIDEAKRYMRSVPARVWRPTGPAGLRTLQLVKGCVRGRAGQFHTKAVPLGGRGRNTSVFETNHVPKESQDARSGQLPLGC